MYALLGPAFARSTTTRPTLNCRRATKSSPFVGRSFPPSLVLAQRGRSQCARIGRKKRGLPLSRLIPLRRTTSPPRPRPSARLTGGPRSSRDLLVVPSRLAQSRPIADLSSPALFAPLRPPGYLLSWVATRRLSIRHARPQISRLPGYERPAGLSITLARSRRKQKGIGECMSWPSKTGPRFAPVGASGRLNSYLLVRAEVRAASKP